MDINFPTLDAKDIDSRIQSIDKKNGKWAILVPYKNARVDMAMLDKVVGAMNWKRTHTLINNNLFCTVSIYNDKIKEWISKEDVGVESNTEKEKGQASDAFKRACFNWGIGRELYTAPFVFINLNSNEVEKEYNKETFRLKNGVSFHVSKISYDENRCINGLEIVDQAGKVRWVMGKKQEIKQEKTKTWADYTIAELETIIKNPKHEKYHAAAKKELEQRKAS